jgi:hypothetical protein
VSRFIKLDAKVLHLSNNYGQLDLLLIYYSNSRKITTFIDDKIKLDIAKNNFIGKDRTIKYIDEISNHLIFETLLVSSVINISTIDLKSVETIVILNNSITPVSLLELGFITVKEEKNIIILKRD